MDVSPEAVARLGNIKAEEGDSDLKLRVFVTGGGCAGFQYGFTLDEEVAPDDAVITQGDETFLVDPLSYQYLEGSVVHYEEGLQGARFTIENPAAVTTCGCGASFAI